MIKFKRSIWVDKTEFVTWFGMEIKTYKGRPKVNIYLYTGDPKDGTATHHLINNNFSSKEDAVKFAVEDTRRMYSNMIDRQILEKQEIKRALLEKAKQDEKNNK